MVNSNHMVFTSTNGGNVFVRRSHILVQGKMLFLSCPPTLFGQSIPQIKHCKLKITDFRLTWLIQIELNVGILSPSIRINPSSSVGIDFRRQNPTKVDPRTVRVNIFIKAVDP